MSTPDTPPAAKLSSPPTPEPSGKPSEESKPATGKLHSFARSLGMSSDARDMAIGTAESLSRLAAGAAGDAGVPGLSGGISVLAEMLNKLRTMSANLKGIGTLNERIERLSASVNTFQSLSPDEAVPEDMPQRIADLIGTWSDIGKRAEHIAQRGRFKRFVMSGADATELEDLIEQINTSIADFLVHEVLDVGKNVHHVRQDVKAVKAQLDVTFIPLYAKRAQYDASSVRKPCTEGTRVATLTQIYGWVLPLAAPNAVEEAQAGIIFWINGLAGMGKTTIAYSVAAWCKAQGILGASFFCSRQDAECCDPNLVFITICRQLCQFHAPIKAKVAEVIQRDPSILHASPYRQFEELILRPLEELKDALPKVVIVIDALDECQDEEAISTILHVLANVAPRVAQSLGRSLLFILTGRPEARCTVLFNKSRVESLSGTTTTLDLHLLKPESAKDDVRRCIKQEFEDRAGLFEVEENWPTDEDMERLAELSEGLVIWATTAVRFIMDTHALGVPEERMHSLIHSQPDSPPQGTILDSLYVQIARTTSPGGSMVSAAPLQRILGAIALAREPLSSIALGGILGMSANTVRNSLIGLRSVVYVPEDHHEAIRIIHPTFAEFLLATQPSKPDVFCISAPEQHAFLFFQSVQAMQSLKRNIAGIRSHLSMKMELPTLDADVERCIPPHLSYASRHWSLHLDGAVNAPALVKSASSFKEFLHQHFLHWLEICSLLGALEGAIAALDAARRTCQATRDPFAGFVPLLDDFHRFAMTYYPCIDVAPLQLYRSVLAFAPTQSLVKHIYDRELDRAPVVQRGAMSDWGPCIDVFLGHGGSQVTSVAFSPNGSQFATTGMEGNVVIRHATTRTVLKTLEGHTDEVMCVAYSPDGLHVVSGSTDKTLRIWEVASGEQVRILRGHQGAITFVTYSADGSRIVSATRGGGIKLWSTLDGQCLLTRQAHVGPTWQVALSPDGARLAYGAEDSLCLFDVVSRSCETLSHPGRGRAASFSSDGRYVAANTETTIRIWTMTDRSLVRSIDVPSAPFRLAFSANNTQLGCGLKDGTIFLWHIESSDELRVLQGHTSRVYSIAWSPDDSQIVSASGDNIVRVWDVSRSSATDSQQLQSEECCLPLPNSPRPTVLCKGASVDIFYLPLAATTKQFRIPDDAPTITLHANIAEAWDAALSASFYNDLDMGRCIRTRDWELLTGQRHIPLSWRSTTMSQDGSLLAYIPPSSDKTVKVCNLRTGAVVATLSGHNKRVLSAAFSPDGSLLATGSREEDVRVWSIVTNEVVAGHTAHAGGWVRAVAFSSDGRLLASGAGNSEVRVYNLATQRMVHTLLPQHFRADVMRVAFSADDAHVVALYYDRKPVIWDAATGDRIYQVSLEANAWIKSLNPSPDDTGVVVRGGGGATHKVNIGEPDLRIWPFYHVSKEGWVTAKSPGVDARRLCWLPPEWRNVFSLGGPMFCALDCERKRSVVVDVSQVPEFIEGWGHSLRS